MQPSLFDDLPSPPAKFNEPLQFSAGLDRLAFLYTATERGNSSGIRFAMSVDDAMTWCESDISRGVLHGTMWAYFWTSARHFLGHWSGYGRAEIDITGYVDDGSWDARIASLGLTKIPLTDFRRVLAKYGVRVIDRGQAA